MDLVKRLGEYRDRERELAWEGTFAQYFEIATKQPSVAQLSHERIYNMMMAAGVETTRSGDPRYKFFGQDIFGLDKPLQQIVEYFHSAAQRLEVRKRILLLMGPVGGGKSTIVYLLKRGLEQYTRSQEGATYAIKECPMHEEPLHLIPPELREEVEREFGLYIEGDLCPACRWMVQEKYGGKIEDIPVKRVGFSEKNRVGIGTFTPSDPKCVTGDTLVLTSEGLRSMEDIYLSLERKPREDEFVPFETTVLGVDGPEQSAKFYCGGFQPIYEVETNLGYTIRGTANHPLLTLLPGGETAWKKIGELQPGDYVALARGSHVFGQSATLPESFYPLPLQPKMMTPELAYWLGLLTAEGSVTAYETWFVNASPMLIERFTSLTTDLFGLEAVAHRKGQTYNYNISISNKALSTWLRGELGIKRGSHAKAIPACVLASSEADVLAFLEGLFWGDATIRGDSSGSNTFKYTSKSRQLARQVHAVLLNLGIVGSLWHTEIEGERYYNVTLRGDQVLDLVALIPSLRQKATSPLRDTRSNKTNFDHLPHGSTLLNGHGGDSYLARILSGQRELSYQRAQTVLAERPTLAATALATLVKQQYLWLTVRDVRPAGIEPVYDLLVPGTHSFVADGFVQHNSQDISELVGGIDLSTIGEVGTESDPRAYRFDGELNIANRGLMEFIEILKCASGNSLVYTNSGIRRLDSFAQPDHPEGASREVEIQLATSTGLETATHLYHAGVKPTKRVMTRRGFVSEGAHEHRVLVVNEEGVQVWRRHDELQVGDWVVMQKGQNLWGQDVEIEWKQPQTQGQTIRVPERMTPGLARWLGYLIAEGCTRSGTIDFACSEEELRNDFCQLTKQLFGVQPTPKPERILIQSRALVGLLKYLGFETGACYKEIPWSVLESSRECVLEFLAGYFAGDGTVNLGGRLSWTTASELLSRQLQMVLLNLGVVSRRTKVYHNASKDAPKQPYWNVAVAGEDADRLASLMRLIPVRKLLSYEKLRAKRQWRDGRADLIPNTVGYWVAISDELQRAVKARTMVAAGGPGYRAREGARQILGGDYVNLHALRTGTNTCTRQMATAILGKLEGWVEPPPGLSALLNPSQFYDEVVSIEDDEADCWDFHVPGSNTFIANGFINHNCDEKFLYVLLTLSQEQNIKTGRFSMIYADEVVVSHTNEAEYQAFVGNRKSEALQDRIILVKVPYNLRVSDEVKIYEKLLRQSALQSVHIAPNTLRIASVFAVLTRLEPSKKAGMSLMKKLKLYDGEDLEDFKQKDIKELQEEAQREGMDGISPRYVINRLSSALVRENTTCINPIDALRALRDGMDQHTGLSREQRERYLNFISEARKEFDELAKKEIQRAFVYSYEESARTLLNNYLDNVEAYCNKTKVRDPITDEDLEPDEQLMRSIEEQIGISENAKKAFREEILIRISSLARRGQTFDYTSHERLKEAIEKKLFADLRDVVKITTSSRTPDAEQLKKINEVVNRLIKDHGYCHVCANELLKYAGNLLNR
jgi:predicted Ser/Thr protein kinase/intein/homing endonuclease